MARAELGVQITADGSVRSSPPAQAPTGPESPAPPPAPGKTVPLRVPERPARAPEVRLSGDLSESAFVEPQLLVQRDGQFIQLTELLYRLLERMDGKLTIPELAAAVSQPERQVSPEAVNQLIATKLMPLGLVPTADGKVIKPDAPSGILRSPLSVNLKMAMVPAEVAQRIANILRPLYWPPILVVTVAAIVLVQGWLYFVHGIGAPVHDVLYRPTLLVAVMGLVLLATGFHELGHAAALQYGGGKVRAMGAGFYLIYPAFYTDVTDSYRLGRGGRIRTDLGGIYFSLIAATGIVALYALTGWEFLLVTALLLNIQTVQQLMPFVRLDGYWLLADITGIPDFFTHMVAFVRSILPIPGWRGQKLPELKPWARAVFAGYILLVVPLLAFVLFLAIKALPRLLATSWDSFLRQIEIGREAVSTGDLVGLGGVAVGTVLLALPVLGLVYVLWSLVRGLVLGLWRWSAGSLPRRMVAISGSAAAALLLAALWLPQIPVLPSGYSGPLYTEAADFTAIRPDERGALPDIFGDVVYVPLSESRPIVAFARATEIALTATAQPAVTPNATPTPGVGSPVVSTAPVSAEPLATPQLTPSAAVPTMSPAATQTTAPTTATPAPPVPAVKGDPAVAPTATAAPAPVRSVPPAPPATILATPIPPTATPQAAATGSPPAVTGTPMPSTPTLAPAQPTVQSG